MKTEYFTLYGMRFTIAGDTIKARTLAYLARILLFQTKQLVNVNKLDIVKNKKIFSDGSIVQILSQHGIDSAYIYVPIEGKKVGIKYKLEQKIRIVPYLFASENSFPSGGMLVCLGGFNFSGPYELLSPFGSTSEIPTHRYQPYSYINNDGETIVIDWQLNNYKDYSRLVEDEKNNIWLPTFWDEYPWMTGGGYDWDSTFYTQYNGYIDEGEKPYKITEEQISIIYDPDWVDTNIEFLQWESVTALRVMTVDNIPIEIIYEVTARKWVDDPVLDPIDLWSLGSHGNWHEVGTTLNLHDYCIDQANPENWCVLYSYQDYNFENYIEGDLGSEGIVEYGEATFIFHGLGFNCDLSTKGFDNIESITNSLMRLYNINDTYICIFNLITTNKRYLGSCIQNKEIYLVDVTDGILYNNEYRNLFTGSYTNWMGIILRKEPEVFKKVL